MSFLTLDSNKLLSIEDLCLVGLSKVYISIEPELAKKIGLDTEGLKASPECNGTTHSTPLLGSKDEVKSRMICCNVLQQALRWKPKPNALLINRIVRALNRDAPFGRFPVEPRPFAFDMALAESPGIARMLSTVASPKADHGDPAELLEAELGLSPEELKSYTNQYTELLSSVSVLGAALKSLSNLSDLNLGIACEALCVPYDFLLLPELQKIPNAMETVRNLLWLTEDSKLIPKKGGDTEVKSLVSSCLVLSGELRFLSGSVLREVSKILAAVYSSVVQQELRNVVGKAWHVSLTSHINGLTHTLKNAVHLHNQLLTHMLCKYSDSFHQALSNSVEGLDPAQLNGSLEKYNGVLKRLRERLEGLTTTPSLGLLEELSDLYSESTTLSLSLSLNMLNLKELSDLKAFEKKAKANKPPSQKSILGHGNELYKNFVDKELCQGVKHCDSRAWDDLSNALKGAAVLNLAARFEGLLVPQNQKTRLPKLPKGTMDFLPNEMLTRRLVINSIKDVFRQHGAVEIETPVFELKETLLGKYGEDQKLIFDLKDQGGEQLSMRYDLTVPFARFVAMNKVDKIKRFHIGKVYRRDEPQLARGRYREFYQCDLDCAGEYPKMVPDSEVIFILVRVLRLLKGGHFHVKVNHRAILDALLMHCGVELHLHRTICSSIDKLDKLPWEKVKYEMVAEKGLPEYTADKIKYFIEIKGTFNHVLGKLRDQNIDSLGQPLEEMELLSSYLDAFGVTADEVVFDLSLARGLDYYTGVIFEAVLEGEEVGSVGGGGRYDGLIGMFSGKPIPAVGMSVGIERLFRTMPRQTSGDLTDVFVCTVGSQHMFLERMKLCTLLWNEGVRAEFLYNVNANLRKQMDAAVDKSVSVIVIVGDSELKDGTVKIKRLSYDDQERFEDVTVKREEMAASVKSLLSRHTKHDQLLKTLFKH